MDIDIDVVQIPLGCRDFAPGDAVGVEYLGSNDVERFSGCQYGNDGCVVGWFDVYLDSVVGGRVCVSGARGSNKVDRLRWDLSGWTAPEQQLVTIGRRES